MRNREAFCLVVGYLIGTVSTALVISGMDQITVSPEEVFSSKLDREDHEIETVAFSHRLETAMQMTSAELIAADDNDLRWRSGDYWIVPQRFRWRAYEPILVAIPVQMETDYIWKGSVAVPDKTRWFYLREGDDTVIHPIGFEQERIIESIQKGIYRY